MFKFEVGKCYRTKYYGDSMDYETVYKVISRTKCSVKIVCLKERYTWCACDGWSNDWREINGQPKTHRVRISNFIDENIYEEVIRLNSASDLRAHYDIFEE